MLLVRIHMLGGGGMSIQWCWGEYPVVLGGGGGRSIRWCWEEYPVVLGGGGGVSGGVSMKEFVYYNVPKCLRVD